MKIGVLPFIILFCWPSFALVELSGEYGLSKNLYGSQGQNEIQNTSYSGSLAWYVFETTAIEFNYVQSKNVNTQNLSAPSSGDYISRIQSEVDRESYGVGIRQLLSSSKSAFKPMVSLGYAKEINHFSTTYTLEDVTAPSSTEIVDNPVQVEDNSVFATFALHIEFSKHFNIRGSVSSYFPAFEFDQWDNDLRYSAGISILFF